MFKLELGSFRMKLTLTLIFVVLFSYAMSTLFIYKYTSTSQTRKFEQEVIKMTRAVASVIDGDLVARIPLNKDGIDSPLYEILLERLVDIKDVNPSIRRVYIISRKGKGEILQFVMGADVSSEKKEDEKQKYSLGDKYDEKDMESLLLAFMVPTLKTAIGRKNIKLVSYAPIYNQNGNSVAVLGMDIGSESTYEIKELFKKQMLILFGLGFVLSIILGVIVSDRMISPIKNVLTGIRHIAGGNLQYRVEVTGDDEISELAESFNRMAARLYNSRKIIHDYFYRSMRSFIRIMEARDPYTSGHSERVAGYVEKIAFKMRISKEKMAILKEAAVLHDIGKLGVQESVLTKREKLTEAEWAKIRRHPTIGEEILRPVFLDKDTLAVIKEHHERFDGNGYPAGISGAHINIFAQILSVADAYDAMTTARAYRAALAREQAIEELKKNKGTQFNPEIVDIFVKILQEEYH